MIFKSYIYINVLRIENAKVILVVMKQPTQLLAGFSDYITLSSKTDKEITAVKWRQRETLYHFCLRFKYCCHLLLCGFYSKHSYFM